MRHVRIALLALAIGTAPLMSLAADTAARPVSAARQTVTLDVKNMTCEACPITVKKSLTKVPGVIDAKVDYNRHIAVVTYDPAKASVVMLTRATTHGGYPSSVKP